MIYRLDLVSSDLDWMEMHEIRREVLFDGFEDGFVYDENHPDDRLTGNFPYLMRYYGQAIGVARLDIKKQIGIVRLVAIAKVYQHKGHGRVLEALIEEKARDRGLRQLRINAEEQAIGFYHRLGWTFCDWDPTELVGLSAGCRQMIKSIV